MRKPKWQKPAWNPADNGQPDIRLEDAGHRKRTTVIPCTDRGVSYLVHHFGQIHDVKFLRVSWNLLPDDERAMLKAGLIVADGRKLEG